MLEKFVSWFFAAFLREIKTLTEEVRKQYADRLAETLEELKSQMRPKVYVTVRGKLKEIGGANDGRMTAHAWTQSFRVDPDDIKTVPFTPYSSFEVERVDVLGPATIAGVKIGNMSAVGYPFDAPATVEVSGTIDPGSLLQVTLKGLP